MRPQITSYLYPDTKKWLSSYATKLGMHPGRQVHNPVLGREVDIWQTTPGAGRSDDQPDRR